MSARGEVRRKFLVSNTGKPASPSETEIRALGVNVAFLAPAELPTGSRGYEANGPPPYGRTVTATWLGVRAPWCTVWN